MKNLPFEQLGQMMKSKGENEDLDDLIKTLQAAHVARINEDSSAGNLGDLPKYLIRVDQQTDIDNENIIKRNESQERKQYLEEKERAANLEIEGIWKAQQANKEVFLQKKFEHILENKFDLIPPGIHFDPSVDGIDGVSLRTAEFKDDNGKLSKNIQAEVWEKGATGNDISSTFSINERGGYSWDKKGRLKNVRSEAVFESILDGLADANLGKWIVLEKGMKIIPPDLRLSTPRGKAFEHRDKTPDKKRLFFFINHPDSLGGLCTQELSRVSYGRGGKLGPGEPMGGLSEYHAFVFPRGVIFENPVRENNIYFYYFSEEDMPEGRIPSDLIEKTKKHQLGREEQEQLAALVAKPEILEQQKKDLQAAKLKYKKRHTKISAPEKIKEGFYRDLDQFIKDNFV